MDHCDKWILKRCLMNQSLSCTVVVLHIEEVKNSLFKYFDVYVGHICGEFHINRALQVNTRTSVFGIYF